MSLEPGVSWLEATPLIRSAPMGLPVSTGPGRNIPTATYRLQYNAAFTFSDAARLVPYLHDLGITACYASSYLKAVPGSPHGYDVADPTRLNPEVGTEADYRDFIRCLAQHKVGQILDVVPNHMGIGKSANEWWQDVLENGPSSPYATFFDIDWHPIKSELEDKVLLPILADQYGTVLENQEIQLEYDEAGRFFVRYYDHRLPVSPRTSVRILSHRLDELIGRTGESDPQVRELQSILTALEHLPARRERDPRRVAERYREKEIAQRRLAAVVARSAEVRAFIQENLDRFNGDKDDPKSFDLLDALLNEQVYRLAHWRVASEEINYRRFFDVNELAAIRMEDPIVFGTAHRFVFALLKDGAVTGLRIDHVDGLYDPGRYLRQLQDRACAELATGPDAGDRPLYVVVEKILGKGEALPEDWPVHGTTGYDFLNQANGLFVDASHRRAFEELYARFIDTWISYDDLVYETKKLIMRVAMSSEINVLGHQLNRLSERDRRHRDFTLNSLTNAIREIIACFPVYRTYVTDGPEPVSDRDRAYITQAVAKAKRKNPALSGLVFEFVQSVLLKEVEARSKDEQEEQARFVMKFQQTTGPVTAKGIEDTAYYIHNSLVSLNEVGGDPTQFGLSVAAFHEAMRQRQARWPGSLSATSTHDTKRGEDVRARINVLSETPRAWKARLTRWSRLNEHAKTVIDGQAAPGRNEECLLYQTLLGAWPPGEMDEATYRGFCDRIQAYMTKALREAKLRTSWVNPNKAYERAVRDFIERILDRSQANPFLEDLLPFQGEIARLGLYNSLSQVLLKVAAPGVPDFYQGTELWDFNLVDPDNRRPVDYARRAALLADLKRACAEAGPDRRRLVEELLANPADGRVKLYVTTLALQYRRNDPALFLHGDYVPLKTGGAKQAHLCAFARIHEDRAVVAVVPRLVYGLTQDARVAPLGSGVWQDTWVTVPSWRPGSPYRHLFTGDRLTTVETGRSQVLPVAEVLRECPVGLLERVA